MRGELVFGIGAYGLLPVAPLPNVDFPTITVTASYPGASPQTMASAIATPLEQQFTQIPALDQMTSLSGIGTTTITLQFDLSRNIDGAAVDVVTAINAAAGLLPKDLPSPPTYRKVNPADFPIMIYAVHSDAVPEYRLDDYANTVLGERLSTVPGIGQVPIFGQKLYAARLQMNPAARAAHGIGLEDVRNALVNATVNEPKGTIEGPDQVVALETNDQLFNADAYGNIIIAYRNGAPVRIKDVGNALDSVQNARVGAWFNNKPAEGIAIQKAPGANTVALLDTIKALMPKLQQSIPPAVHVDQMLAYRSLHPALRDGRRHRAIVPRIRDHRVGRCRGFGNRVADPDAGHVLAIPEGAGAAPPRPFQPSGRALLRTSDRSVRPRA